MARTLLSDPEVEVLIRRRLYDEHRELRATPMPRGPRARDMLAGRYRLLDPLQAGKMASVHRAWDARLERTVAVKVIDKRLARDPSVVQRFRSEAQLCARVAHPNVVAVFDAGSEPRDFIVMELIDGCDGRTLVKRRGLLTASETVNVISQVCDALAHVHARGVVHGDVSLANVLINRPDGIAKLADFGLAASLDGLREGAVMGTPGYVAPEVLDGANPSAQSDLYSLAVAAYNLLAGVSWRAHADPDATVPGPTAAPRMPPLAEMRPDLARPLVEAIQRSLAHDPTTRHQSVSEFGAALTASSSTPVTLEPRIGAPTRIPTAALPRAA